MKRYSSSASKTSFFKRKSTYLIAGVIIGAMLALGGYQTASHYSTDESCMSCHVHPQAEQSWKLSKHVNNGSGVKTHCVDCHLPPQNNTWDHYSAKAALGIKDVWGFFTKDSADFNWETKSELEHAVKFIPNESCKECHQNIFPEGIKDDGITAHLYYDTNEKKLDLQCISCHLDAGHYNPNYSHGKLAGIPGAMASNAAMDSSLLFKAPTTVTAFESFTEQIPGTFVPFQMQAIPGGSFKMGSTPDEDFHNTDEAPVRNITVSPFFMAELEVTWDQFWAFYGQTMSEGRTSPETVYANNSNPLVDAISGPTAPFGFPDQGWGNGDRPAITMTHYAAETFCQWISKKTGKKYRLPTEAEWEYAARGGTETAYFFAGDPKSFSDKSFWRKFIDAETAVISDYIIYEKNSRNKTQEPSQVMANPYGLKNMLGNVAEYCADKYDPAAYTKNDNATNPRATTGEAHVIRGGSYNMDAAALRCASRDYTKHEAWLKTDPQQPKSIWWYSDIKGIGFRVVCEADNASMAQ